MAPAETVRRTMINRALTYDDLVLGRTYHHPRGRTVDNTDNLRWTLGTLNTAQAHFDLPYARELLDGAFTERLVMGGCTIALVVGLTSEDLAENALRDLCFDDIVLRAPVFCGDTLRAHSTVVELTVDDETAPGTGIVGYRFTGTKDEGTVVCEGFRRLVVRRDTEVGS